MIGIEVGIMVIGIGIYIMEVDVVPTICHTSHHFIMTVVL